MKSYSIAKEDIVDNDIDKLEQTISETENEIIINKTKIFSGILLVIGIGISWVLSTQFAQYVQTKSSVTIPPFALMWFATSFKIFCCIPLIIRKCNATKYELMMTPNTPNTPQSVSIDHQTRNKISYIFNAEEYDPNEIEQNSTATTATTTGNYGTNLSSYNYEIEPNIAFSNKLSLDSKSNCIDPVISTQINVTPNNLRMLSYYCMFYLLWIGANYSYIKSLDSSSATIVTAIFSSNNIFIYILSIFVLNEIFSWLRMSAVLTAIVGILFIALSNTEKTIVLIGSVLALMSSIFAAIYKVYFKKIFGDMDVWNVCRFLSWIGLFNLCFVWIIVLILHETGLERLPTDENINDWPWGLVIASAFAGLTFDFLINFGIVFTYPLFIALGVIIGIPFNLLVDIIWNELSVSIYQMIGVGCICGGFFIIVFTDFKGNSNRSHSYFRKRIRIKR